MNIFIIFIKSLFCSSLVFISQYKNNTVIIGKHKKSVIKIRFKGHKNNQVKIEKGFKGKLTINFSGNNNKVLIRKNVTLSGSKINITQSNSQLIIGNDVTIGHNNKISINDYIGSPSIKISDDCMISSNVEIRTYDSHPIYNLNDEIINADNQDIVIKQHVWIGQDVKIMKNVTIGQGSIIGAGSIVTKTIPNNCVAVGIPAKVIRKNDFYWSREPMKEYIKQAKELSY
ncbi:acyltransferase [Photobacterium phosphoreum]|uniref:Acyltransferase n=1 Tax=Photobacterium phosphoreum TaxID=659 RepID=A0A2T3JSB7_PHOPO|nr:acyltransferase [Photobacterium phosphoreum]PSU25230.1 acyltransferase [Photobacterium phosphoreum]PSU42752.1 acyltransferase [Photobacterium phosphoreum]PSU52028.1 acyltransferase [Photobacterium phosphoreum]